MPKKVFQYCIDAGPQVLVPPSKNGLPNFDFIFQQEGYHIPSELEAESPEEAWNRLLAEYPPDDGWRIRYCEEAQ